MLGEQRAPSSGLVTGASNLKVKTAQDYKMVRIHVVNTVIQGAEDQIRFSFLYRETLNL